MSVTTQRRADKDKPAWELAERYPVQGKWDETEYLALDNSIENQRTIELVDGFLEFLPMPSRMHERIVKFLFAVLLDYSRTHRVGEVFFSGRKVKLWENEIRLPDIVFSLHSGTQRSTEDYEAGADLVMEVVSKSAKDRRRDRVEKRVDYARAGIREYWIVDPELKKIEVLKLSGKSYVVHGEFEKGEKATSVLLKDFEVDVTAALAGLKY